MYIDPKMRLMAKDYDQASRALNDCLKPYLSPKSIQENVLGLGIGVKWVNGQPTGEPALVVLVTKKQGVEQLSAKDQVPKQLSGMQTDVVSIGDVKADGGFNANYPALNNRIRPLQGGYSVGRLASGGAGTIASGVHDTVELNQDNLQNPNFYILSNNHVLAGNNQADIGDEIIQPGMTDGGSNSDIVAKLTRFVSIDFEPQTPRDQHRNFIDAAIAKADLSMLTREVHWCGKPQGWKEVSSEDVGTIVHKTGRTTGYNFGRIIAVNATVDVGFDSERMARFKQQILISPMSAPGDSGSLIMDVNNKALGLLFAGSDQATIANPISLVRALLGVELD